MTPREHDAAELPELLVVVASEADATALAPLGHPDDQLRPVLVATGPDPMLVDGALDDLGVFAGRTLLLDGPCDGPAEESARLLPRLDAVVGEGAPAAVVVRGGSIAALAAAQAAVWRGVPLVALPAPVSSAVESANQAAIAELASWQTSPSGGVTYPAQADLLVHRRLGADAAPRLVYMPGPRGATGAPSGLTA